MRSKKASIFAKQRNGPIDTVKLSFLKEYTRFESYADEDRRTGRMFANEHTS